MTDTFIKRYQDFLKDINLSCYIYMIPQNREAWKFELFNILCVGFKIMNQKISKLMNPKPQMSTKSSKIIQIFMSFEALAASPTPPPPNKTQHNPFTFVFYHIYCVDNILWWWILLMGWVDLGRARSSFVTYGWDAKIDSNSTKQS